MKNLNTLITLLVLSISMLSCSDSNIFLPENNLIPVKSGNKWGYVNSNGKYIINPQFKSASPFKEGLALVKSLGDNSKLGYINTKGEIIIPPRFTSATMFSEGLACVTEDNSAPFYIDKTGKKQIIFKDAEIAFVFTNGLALYAEYVKDKKANNDKLLYGFINKQGNKIINAQYKKAMSFSNGLAAVMNNNNLWGFIDINGKLVINYQFDKVGLFSKDGYAVVYNGELWGVINKNGKFIINPQFDAISDFTDGLNPFLQGEQVGFINNEGKIIINPQFDVAKKFSNNLALVKSSNLWGFIDETGKFVINPQFDKASSFIGDFAIVKSNNKYGFINNKGEYTVNLQFNDVYNGLFYYPSNCEIGLFDFNETYVKSNYVDFPKTIKMIVNSASEDKFNNLNYYSNLLDLGKYLKNLDIAIDTNNISKYTKHYEVKIKNASKDIELKIKAYFINNLIKKKYKKVFSEWGGTYKTEDGYLINRGNHLRKIKYTVYLSGKASSKIKSFVNQIANKFTFMKKEIYDNRIQLINDNYSVNIEWSDNYPIINIYVKFYAKNKSNDIDDILI